MLVRTRPFLLKNELLEVIHNEGNDDAIAQFEMTLSRHIGGGSCIALHQGRDALALILQSLNLRPGDEIIIPNFICRVVADTIIQYGGTPVVVDSSLKDFNVSIYSIADHISSRTIAILVNHLYGLPCDILEIKEVAKKHSVLLIEDCAQALSSKINGRNVGSFGDVAFFSFNFDKPISTGLGGALIINNLEMIPKIENLLKRFQKTTLNEERQILTQLYIQFLLTDSQVYKNFLPTHFACDLNRLPPIRNKLEKALYSDSQEFLKHITKHSGLYKKVAKIYRRLSEHSRTHSLQRMNSLRAAYAMELLKKLPLMNTKINENAAFYAKELMNSPVKMSEYNLDKASDFLRFTILNKSMKTRGEIIKRAKHFQIEFDYQNWSHTISQEVSFVGKIKHNPQKLGISTLMVKEIIHLPIHYYVSNEQREKAIEVFSSLF